MQAFVLLIACLPHSPAGMKVPWANISFCFVLSCPLMPTTMPDTQSVTPVEWMRERAAEGQKWVAAALIRLTPSSLWWPVKMEGVAMPLIDPKDGTATFLSFFVRGEGFTELHCHHEQIDDFFRPTVLFLFLFSPFFFSIFFFSLFLLIHRLCSTCWPLFRQNLTFKGTWWKLNHLSELVLYLFFSALSLTSPHAFSLSCVWHSNWHQPVPDPVYPEPGFKPLRAKCLQHSQTCALFFKSWEWILKMNTNRMLASKSVINFSSLSCGIGSNATAIRRSLHSPLKSGALAPAAFSRQKGSGAETESYPSNSLRALGLFFRLAPKHPVWGPDHFMGIHLNNKNDRNRYIYIKFTRRQALF